MQEAGKYEKKVVSVLDRKFLEGEFRNCRQNKIVRKTIRHYVHPSWKLLTAHAEDMINGQGI